MLPALPPVHHIVQPIAIENRCVIAASAYYDLPPEVLVALRIQEGGHVGKVSVNTNQSIDMGPMQINSIHVKKFAAYGISKADLVHNECTNIFAGAYILRSEIRGAGEDLWKGIGNYHSRRPSEHIKYRNLIAARLRKLYARYAPYVGYLRQQAYSLRVKYIEDGTVQSASREP